MNESTRESRQWRVSTDRVLTLDQPRLIGVLNVTPDSFSDGGRFDSIDAAVGHAQEMIAGGACMIDVGGESTRPGASRVDVDEQIHRVVPVIRAIAADHDVLISTDTTSSRVAAAALDAGAHVINDVSAGQDDAQMLPLAAARGCGLILMHRRVRPDQDQYSDQYAAQPEYQDVVVEVRDFLIARAEAAIQRDVNPAAIVIDPGLGFGKSVEQNFELIARTAELAGLGFPLLSAASRKSFIGKASGVAEPSDRVPGSVAVSVAHYMAGVRLFRVHDVKAHGQALKVAATIDATCRRPCVTITE